MRKRLPTRSGPLTQTPDVFEALCAEASRKVQDFNAQEIANTLWVMAKTGTQMPDVFEGLCAEAIRKVQDFNAQNCANILWAMGKTGTRKLEVLEAVRRRAAQLSASRSLSESDSPDKS